MDELYYIILPLLLAILFLLLIGRLIGWALGISVIPEKQKTIIRQNEEILDRLDQIVRIQTARADQDGILYKDEDILMDRLKNDPRYQNQA